MGTLELASQEVVSSLVVPVVDVIVVILDHYDGLLRRRKGWSWRRCWRRSRGRSRGSSRSCMRNRGWRGRRLLCGENSLENKYATCDKSNQHAKYGQYQKWLYWTLWGCALVVLLSDWLVWRGRSCTVGGTGVWCRFYDRRRWRGMHFVLARRRCIHWRSNWCDDGGAEGTC